MKLRSGLPRLRNKAEYVCLRSAFAAGCDRHGFRLVHFVVEAPSRKRLTRGVRGLAIRVARALNKAWRRKGKVFGERYHDRVLKTPRRTWLLTVGWRRHGRLPLDGPAPLKARA